MREQAIDALGRVTRSDAELDKTEQYAAKRQGMEALDERNPDSDQRAYYILKEASRRWPQDGELLELLGNAERALSAFSFFRDTAPNPEGVSPRDRVRRVAFVNRREGGLVEIVYADSVVRIPRTIDVKEGQETKRPRRGGCASRSSKSPCTGSKPWLSAAAASSTTCTRPSAVSWPCRKSRPRLRGSATRSSLPARPRARSAGSACSRSLGMSEGERLEPRFTSGSEARFTGFGLPARDKPVYGGGVLLPLMVPLTTLWTLGLDAGSVRERDVIELWTLSQATASLAVRVELALRAVGPFLLLLLGAVAASVASRHPPAAAPPPRTYLLTPAVAAAGYLAFALALHVVRVAVVVLADRLGWPLGMAVLAVAILGLLWLALVRMDHTLRRAL